MKTINITNGDKLWFTSDLHHSHTNIIKYNNRPWDNVYDMNDGLLANWNSKIKPDDIVVHIGDFTFSRDMNVINNFLDRLNGKIIMVWGNHDWMIRKEPVILNKLLDYGDLIKLKVNQPNKKTKEVVCCHFPFMVWENSHYGAFNCFGHAHGSLTVHEDSRQMDVGVDTNNWLPYSFKEIYDKLEPRKGLALDHHD